MRAIDNAKNQGDWSDAIEFEVKDATAPRMNRVTAKQLDADSIEVNWVAATDNNKNQISKYVIECNDVTQEVNGDILTCTFDNVTNTRAVISVTAYDAAGLASNISKINLNIKDMIAPEKVTGVKKDKITNNYQGTFSWTIPADNSGRIARYQVIIDGNENKYYTTSQNKINISNLSVGIHTIQVRAIDNAKNQGNWSEEFIFVVDDVTAPNMGRVSAKQEVIDNEPTTITVEWDPAKDNNQNKISKYVITCNRQTKEVDGNTFSWTFSDVEGTKAVITVTAYDMADEPNASASKKVNLTIKDMIDPGQVTGVDTVSIDKYRGTFTWKEVVEEDFGKVAKYQVKIDGNENKYYTTSQNKISISNLSVGKHTIQVRAVDKAQNDGEWSEEFTFFVKDVTAPNTVSVSTKVTANDVTLTWKKPKDNADSVGQGVTEYILSYGDANDTTKDSWTTTTVDALTGADTSSYDIMGLNKGKYKFEMIARDAAGNESKVKTGSFEIKTELPVPALLELETTLLGPAGSDTDLTSWNSGGTQDTSIYDPASSTTDLLSDDPGSYAADISSLASADVSTLFGLDEKQNSGSLAVLG